MAAVREKMLPSLPPDPANELDAAVEAARSEIARSIQVSGLKNDPLVHLMHAVSASLEAQHRLHRASTSHLRDVSGRLDQQVAEATTTAESVISACQATVVAELTPQMTRFMEQSIRSKLWTIKLRTILAATGAAVVLGLASVGTGFGLGYATGQDAGLRTEEMIVKVARSDGPDAAAIWARLMSDNDPRSAMAACEKSVVRQNGQRACSLPVWLDPPLSPEHPP
jgi:hypothetical protein